MGVLVLLFWIFVSGVVVVNLVSGVWMAVWVAGLVTISLISLYEVSVISWLILGLVYMGGIFILLVYVSGSNTPMKEVKEGGVMVSLGLLVFLVVMMSEGGWKAVFEGGSECMSKGGFMMALLSAPILLLVMVFVNWLMYGHKGAFRSS
uniref:ND6 protein n=1 Tax=Southwellina hispida TaxID=449650 RepID=A0A0C4MVT2_9BILA|nr:NADH dehydrogenase subunit 6 [Southwellina hispida]AIO11158.1 NADH dehydrogenase subunit 6 [Southwellina hispida]